LHALWDTVSVLFRTGNLGFAGWSEKLAGLQPYFKIVGLFAVWAIAWTVVTLWRRQRYLHLPQPPALTIEEEARKISGLPADLSAWRELKISIAHLDSQGKVSVLPKKPEGNQ
jgi:hypothetical protein